MKTRSVFLRLGSALALLRGVLSMPGAEPAPAASPPKVREPAVAGLFYPKDPAALARAIDGYLAAAPNTELPGELQAILCPHAGYEFSGPVAACAYRLLPGRAYDTVVVLAPSHYAEVHAASVSGADVFRTPLGDVPVSPKARALGRQRPFETDALSLVQTPGWAAQSSRRPPPRGEENADTWEHADEVQVPFLQKTLKGFSLVPVVCGEVDPARAARALLPFLDQHTLIVCSSDLSHYDNYANAQKRDRRCVDAICALAGERIAPEDACGATPIRILLQIAKARGWQAQLLDYRNSGDTSGDKTHGVVGYAAIAFYAPAAGAVQFSREERRSLLGLARRAVREVVTTGQLPAVPAEGLAARFAENKGCFVTLTKHGELRGCIGHIIAQEPLYRAILDNARSAALHDPRFPAVAPAELGDLEIEVSVLTAPQPLEFSSPADLLQKLQPHKDGVVLQIGPRGATYLPQVWEQLPDKEEFLESLAQKAGCDRSAWRGPGVKVSIYHVEAFKESEYR